MLGDDPHHAYLELLRRVAKQVVPDVARQDAAIGDRLRRIRGYLKSRTSYAELAQDLQFSRNSWLVSTHPNKTRRRLSRTVEQATGVAAKATADALAKNLIAEQARLELDLFDNAEPLAGDIPASRENPNEDGYNLRFFGRFIGQLMAHDVCRSAMQNAPAYVLSIAADLISWATRDPEFQDPQNPIPHLRQAGLFAVWDNEMTPDEALWIDRATGLDPAQVTAEMQRVFGISLPPDYPMSCAALMGMARIADPQSPLSRIDWDTVRAAHAKVESEEVSFVQSTLGLSDENRGTAEKTVSFLKHRIEDEAIQKFEQSVPFSLIRMMIDNLEPAGREPSEWVPEFCEKIQILAEQLAPIVRSEEVFFAITKAAFEHSFAKTKFDDLDRTKRAQITLKRNGEALKEALTSGLSFKFRSDGMTILENDPEYHLIAQRPMTRETYMGTNYTPEDRADEASTSDTEVEHQTIGDFAPLIRTDKMPKDAVFEAAVAGENEPEAAQPGAVSSKQEPDHLTCFGGFEVVSADKELSAYADPNSHETQQDVRTDEALPEPVAPDRFLPVLVPHPTTKNVRAQECQCSLFEIDDEDMI